MVHAHEDEAAFAIAVRGRAALGRLARGDQRPGPFRRLDDNGAKGEDNSVIAVIGDGSLGAGMAYEAMNAATDTTKRLIVILNDNDMSIAQPTGAMSGYLARMASGRTYMGIRETGKKLTAYLGKHVDRAITRAVEHARGRSVDMGYGFGA